MTEDPRRALPSVDRVLAWPDVVRLIDRHGRGAVRDAIRAVLSERRERRADADGLVGDIATRLVPSLRRVINATGVVLHTNLGRAPLSPAALAAARDVAAYSTLEWDADTGERGSRQSHLPATVTALTGAEDACVTTTNAGAVLLALVALASGREVIVSRGQLVEIGGGFRIPEILTASGCRLVEVGTTNRTRVEDYERAIGPNTAAILRVHPSNFRVVGFTEEAPLRDLVELAHSRGLTMIDDLGSGAVDDDPVFRGEPDVRASVAAGCDVVAFSGDKLLGGPQAGLLVGRREAIRRCARHPLMRALRPDKTILAMLDATLRAHCDPATRRGIPTIAALDASPDDLRRRAETLAAAIGGEVVATEGRVGGGSLPGVALPSFAVALPTGDPTADAARLRALDPPVVGRLHEGRLLLDVLALTADDVADLVRVLAP